jgi:hypothetical protein
MATLNARGVLAPTLTLFLAAAVISSAQDRTQPGHESARPDGFHVVLLLGKNSPGPIPRDLPPGVAKALKEASELLPYKSYVVQDQAVARRAGGDAYEVIGLHGPQSRDYDLALDATYREPARVSVSVNLSYAPGDSKDTSSVLRTEFSARLGETVVVGTSGAKDDESLVLLITPLAARGRPPAGPTEVLETFHGRTVRTVTGGNPFYSVVSGTVQIAIQRWSTDAERDVLVTALKSGRPEAFSAALMAPKPTVGSLVSRGPLLFGNDSQIANLENIQYAWQSRQANGTRRITAILVQPAQQVLRGNRWSVDWVELVLRADGSGEGFESFACQLGLNRTGDDIAPKTCGNPKVIITIFK